MKPNPLPFLGERWRGVERPVASFAGRTIIVTGSNTGLGFHAACTYVELGAEKIILAVRDLAKGAAARQKVETFSKRTSVDVWELDMQNYASIRDFVSRVQALDSLDIVILNAGVSPGEYSMSKEGWESTLQINVLSTALLGILLMPKLRATNGSHLLLVTSEAHRWLEMSDFPSEGNILEGINANTEGWNPLLQNARSKLFAMYVTQELARLADDRVIVSSVCPGACTSDMMRNLVGKSIGLRIFDLIFNKPTEQGGWSYVWASLLGKEANGKWFKTTALTEPGTLVTSEEGLRMHLQVWEEILQSLRNSVPEVDSVVGSGL